LVGGKILSDQIEDTASDVTRDISEEARKILQQVKRDVRIPVKTATHSG
jgi:hypothetical protein